jgi:hypothetical protein
LSTGTEFRGGAARGFQDFVFTFNPISTSRRTASERLGATIDRIGNVSDTPPAGFLFDRTQLPGPFYRKTRLDLV